jgi:hypothetical protein
VCACALRVRINSIIIVPTIFAIMCSHAFSLPPRGVPLHLRTCSCFYASSACIYPEGEQLVTDLSAGLKEDTAWPAQPQDAYGKGLCKLSALILNP